MKRLILPLSIVFGISLFSFSISLYIPNLGEQATIAISDVVIGLLLLYALACIRLGIRGPVLHGTFFLAGVVLLSGVVNAWTDDSFDTGDFAMEYIRIVGLVAMVMLLPVLFRRVGHHRLAQSTVWVVRVHSFMLLAHSLSLLPVSWLPAGHYISRPSGLFGEPSFFAVYMALSVFYVLQVERNSGVRYIRPFDIALIGLALVASASISSVIVLGLFLLTLATRRGVMSRGKVLIGVTLCAMALGLSVMVSEKTGPGKNWEYLVKRVSYLQPQRFKDSSARARLIGSSLLAVEVLKDSPLLGAGLGGTNVHRILDRYREDNPQRVAPLSNTFTPAAVITMAGIIGFLPFAFILGWMLVGSETRLIGISLAAVAFLWGGAFAPIVWWHICLAVSLRGAYRRIGGYYLQTRGQTPREAKILRAA